jgi:chemotaxis protein methyltransferase CheR
MEPRTFARFKEIVYSHSGIVLTEEKLPLLANRLQKRLKALGLESEGEYLKIVELDESGAELWKLIEAVSTNTTHFYRESQHFKVLDHILKEWWAQGKRSFKVWCAAASSGEEPYTIAFQIAQSIDLSQAEVKILATDINTKVLTKAHAGVYGAQSVKGIPPPILDRFLLPMNDSSGSWIVKPEVRSKILFKKLNLVEFPYPLTGEIDIIFCRNVMIYFDVQTRAKIIAEFERLLAAPGHLFISLSESLLGINHSLKKLDTSVFTKEGRQ